MYVCICNALKEAEARRVAPACDAAHEIYDQLGCAPRCGRCMPAMEDIMAEMQPAPASDASMPFAGSPVDLHIVPAE
jgi:bacterioferritin-associated ferredoxin